jgi:xanthine dehydrogenase YagR molybdenum-binding subunit
MPRGRVEVVPTIGQPINRVDGPLKVTGRASYAYEHWENGQPLYGFIVGATIGRGWITAIDPSRAEQSPGVRIVMTYLNAPAQGKPDGSPPPDYWRAQPTLASPEIHHYGEPVAFVVATTFEQAREAAERIEIEYAAEQGTYDFAAGDGQSYAPKALAFGLPTDTSVGDFDGAFAKAAVAFDQSYTTAYQFAQPMEPNACLVVPHGDDLTVYLSTQIVSDARTSIAKTMLIDAQRIQVIAPYVGGGFGSKLYTHAEAMLAVFAARQLQQPVKVTMTRQQIFHMVGMRPTSRQRVRLGAGRDGTLVAIGHEVNMHTSRQDEYAELTALTTRSLYAAPNRITRTRLTLLDLPRGEDVRAPGESTGLLAVECAMDELAHALGMDPIDLRIRNEPTVDPESGVPFSDRRLVECMREGARRFGWERRPVRPATVRDGRWFVGFGMAAGIRAHPQLPTKAKVRIGADGTAVVQSDMTDIGTGTYTILTQVAAEGLGLPIERVRVELGRSDFPVSAGSGGSWGAGNSSVAVYRACLALRETLLLSVRSDTGSPLKDRDPAGAVFSDACVSIGDASETLAAIVGRNYPDGVEAQGEVLGMWQVQNYGAYSVHTYGAHFAEVGVDADTAEVRLRRILGVFAPGRILNEKTARSQLIGGMTFGVSTALMEEAIVDPRFGAFVNRDLAEYPVPVHADIPSIDAVMLDGFDDKANELGVKGLGELGNCGASAAVANAVFNATGVRVRDFPITLDKVLARLPLVDA